MTEPFVIEPTRPCTDTIDIAGFAALANPCGTVGQSPLASTDHIDRISLEKLWHTGFDVPNLNAAHKQYRISPIRQKSDLWTLLGYSMNPRGATPKSGRFTDDHVTALALPYPDLTTPGETYPHTDYIRVRFPKAVFIYSKRDDANVMQRYAQPSKDKTASTSEPYFLIDPDQWTRVKNKQWPLLITEGELKGAALGLAGLAGIAFPGAWMWTAPAKGGKHRLHYALDPNGPRKSWCIPIVGRQVHLIPDIDFHTNLDVRKAFQQLAHALKKAGAGEVRIVHIPDPPKPDLWKGIDDYLTHHLGRRWAGNANLVERAKGLVADLMENHSELVRSNDRYPATSVVRGADRLFERWQQPNRFAALLVAGEGSERPVIGRLRYDGDRYLLEDVGHTAGNTNGKVSVPSLDLQRLAGETYEEGVDLAILEGDMDGKPSEMPTDYPNRLFSAVNRLLPQIGNNTLIEPFQGAGLTDRFLRIRGGVINLSRCFGTNVSWDRRSDWLLPPNHRWFGTGCLNVSLTNLSGEPTCPTFLEMIENGFEGDKDRVGTLQQWFGKVLTCPLFLGLQQFLSLYGVAGSGKSTIYRILLRLLGDDQVTELRANFGGRFDTATVPGKQLVVFLETPDGVNGKFDPYMADVIKSVTGQDRLTVEKKCRTPVAVRAECEVMTIGNHPPTIPMDEGAFRRRAVFLGMSKPILNRNHRVEDWMLADELPGILLWSLSGACRLFAGEPFKTPTACNEDLEDAAAHVSPEERFVDVEIIRKEKSRITPSELEERFREWLRSNRIEGNGAGAKKLGHLIRRKFGVESTPTHVNGKSVRVYNGLGFLHCMY